MFNWIINPNKNKCLKKKVMFNNNKRIKKIKNKIIKMIILILN